MRRLCSFEKVRLVVQCAGARLWFRKWTSVAVQDLERALYMSPQDAQEYGVIDRILKPYEQ